MGLILTALTPLARWTYRLLHRRLRFCDRPMTELVDRARAARRAVDRAEGLDDDYWVQRLRRWAHIIDKGLQWPQREQGHSSRAATEARIALGHVSPERQAADPTVAWASHVLEEYQRFQRSLSPGPPDLGRPEPCPIDYLALHAVLTSRRSVRVFEQRSVSRETIDQVLGVLPWAPSSCSKQVPVAYVTADPLRAWDCLQTCVGRGRVGPHIPCFIAFCCDLRPYELPGELMLPWIDTALGVQNCCLSAHALGLSITLLTWNPHTPAADTALRDLLGIPETTAIIVNGVMGYPAQAAPAPARKAPREAYRWVP